MVVLAQHKRDKVYFRARSKSRYKRCVPWSMKEEMVVSVRLLIWALGRVPHLVLDARLFSYSSTAAACGEHTLPWYPLKCLCLSYLNRATVDFTRFWSLHELFSPSLAQATYTPTNTFKMVKSLQVIPFVVS